MQLAMNIFSTVISDVIFGLNLLCLSAGIVGIYFVVRLASQQPSQVTLMFFVLILNGTVFYVVFWDNVRVIPDELDKIKQALTLQSQT